MSEAKVHIIITDHGEDQVGVKTLDGLIRQNFRFSGRVVGNPEVKANGESREAVLDQITFVLLQGLEEGRPKEIVELDLGDRMVVREVMGS